MEATTVGAFVPAIFFATVVALFWIVFSTIRRLKVARAQSELHSKLIEKLASGPEFLNYLNTEPGKELVASLALEPPGRDPYRRILASVHAGVILLVLGIAFLVLSIYFPGDGVFSILGAVAVALGAGFLISAAFSYRLSKAFGLFERGKLPEHARI